MISFSNVSLFFGDRILFKDISFTIKNNDKIGIVGRNGAGKTTLFKLILKEITPDSGQILVPPDKSIGYLTQELNLNPEKNLVEETLTAFDNILEMEREIKAIEKELTTRRDYESKSYLKLLERLSVLNDIIKHHDHSNMQGNAEKVLKGLGFTDEDFKRRIKEFSQGWQIRVELAKILLRQPDYILLDEPTNHLDIEAIIWLEQYLKKYPGTVLLISHDQRFLDNVTKRTIEISEAKIHDYPVPYSKFVALREERRQKLLAAYANQQAIIKQKERTIERFMAKATKTKLAQSMQKQLDKMEKIEIEEYDTKTMKLIFPPADRPGRIVVKATSLHKSYDDKQVLKDVNLTLERGEKIAFVGQNGQGKTTLAKIIVGQLDYDKGQVQLGYNVKTGYYAQNQPELLDPKLTVLETMENNATVETRANVRNLLGAFMFSGDDVDKKVMVLSGGEKARLAIATMLLRPFNFLVLDEPTNHLDIQSKNVLKQAIKDYNGSVIIVSHDREFLSGLTDKTIEFRDHKLNTWLGDINYFLEKRNIDDIRKIELRDKEKPQIPKKEKPNKISYEERKRLQRELKKTERKIEQIEADIKEIENIMSSPDFHTRTDTVELSKQYETLRRDLDEKMESWEKIYEQILEMDGN